MRFDDSVYRIIGDRLIGLTRERHTLLDPGSYERRSTSSMKLPGALVDDFTLHYKVRISAVFSTSTDVFIETMLHGYITSS